MAGFKTTYTTVELQAANPVTEKDKVVISADTYAQCEMQEKILAELRRRF